MYQKVSWRFLESLLEILNCFPRIITVTQTKFGFPYSGFYWNQIQNAAQLTQITHIIHTVRDFENAVLNKPLQGIVICNLFFKSTSCSKVKILIVHEMEKLDIRSVYKIFRDLLLIIQIILINVIKNLCIVMKKYCCTYYLQTNPFQNCFLHQKYKLISITENNVVISNAI